MQPARSLPTEVADRLILALDVPTVAQARDIVAELNGVVSFYKIGMWLLFQRETDALIDDLLARGNKVFLDYKMYDIGETVRRGVQSAARRGISFVTVHGDRDIITAAVDGRGDSALRLLAITVLTSLDDAAVASMGYRLSARELVELRVRTALECGCDGIVASAQDDPRPPAADRTRRLPERGRSAGGDARHPAGDRAYRRAPPRVRPCIGHPAWCRLPRGRAADSRSGRSGYAGKSDHRRDGKRPSLKIKKQKTSALLCLACSGVVGAVSAGDVECGAADHPRFVGREEHHCGRYVFR